MPETSSSPGTSQPSVSSAPTSSPITVLTPEAYNLTPLAPVKIGNGTIDLPQVWTPTKIAAPSIRVLIPTAVDSPQILTVTPITSTDTAVTSALLTNISQSLLGASPGITVKPVVYSDEWGTITVQIPGKPQIQGWVLHLGNQLLLATLAPTQTSTTPSTSAATTQSGTAYQQVESVLRRNLQLN